MSSTVTGLVVTRGDPPTSLDLPGVSETVIPDVGEAIDPPEWDQIQHGTDPPEDKPGTLRVFLETDEAETRGWAAWWVRQLDLIASPHSPWPDPGYRFFRISLTWPDDTLVVRYPDHDADPAGFSYMEIVAGTVEAELTGDDLAALAA